MKVLLYTQKKSSAAAALVTAILGVVLIFRPDRTVGFLCMLLGAAILITGAIYILGWFSRRKEGVPALFILPGVVLCALGGWLLTRPREVMLLVQFIFGAILLFHGILDLQGAFSLLRQRWGRWWIDLLFALGTIGLGVLILVNPFGALDALVILIGVSLVFDGVSDLILIWRLGRAFRILEGEPDDDE